MKPLLRVVLILDALLLLAFGLLFVLTPWTWLYNLLHLVKTEPALIGQVFGVVLVGLAWLALHASIDGALTTAVGRTAGHMSWLSGLLMLVWLLGMHTPGLNPLGQLILLPTAVFLVVFGLGSVRLASAVRRREKLRLAEAVAAERAERQAAKDAAKDAANRRESQPLTAGFPVYRAEPAIEPAMPVSHAVPPVASAAGGVVGEPGLTATERAELAEREEARSQARNAAADAPGSGRPPFRG